MVDFSRAGAVVELTARTRTFVRDVVIPAEARDSGHGVDDALRRELQSRARAEGLLAPHVSTDYGGLGLDLRDRSDVFEEAGYSLLGPQALNCAAPDEGNMHLLGEIATAAQREHYLRRSPPARSRSCFAMTEPARRRLRPVDAAHDGYPGRRRVLINGEKRLITGAEGARFSICMAPHRRHEDAVARPFPRRRGQPGLPGRAGDPDHRPAHSQAGTATSSSPTASCPTRRARRSRPRLPLRAGSPRAGAADALHALARNRARAPRPRARRTPPGARRSASGWRASAWCRRCSPTR